MLKTTPVDGILTRKADCVMMELRASYFSTLQGGGTNITKHKNKIQWYSNSVVRILYLDITHISPSLSVEYCSEIIK